MKMKLMPEQVTSLPDSNNGTTDRMAWFRAFRGDFGYSNYGDYRTSVTWDIPFTAIIYTCVLISLAAIIAAAGIRGKERWYTLIRLVYSLAVGSSILVSLYGYCWQLGEVGVHAPYIYRSTGNIQGVLGVRIGLKTVNLTLIGTFTEDNSVFKYNEEITLENVIKSPPQTWNALERGLPQPLLSIIEYFDIDNGGLRFGRAFFMAGYFANILLWTAFAFWVTGNILLCSVIWYGAACFTLTGVCMILAVVVYDHLSPQNQIKMPCSDGALVLSYAWCFWSTMVFGILTTVIGIVLFALDKKVPKKLARFFLLDTSLDDTQAEYLHYGSLASNPAQGQSAPVFTTLSTPGSTYSLRSLADRSKGRKSPVNWYVNYGCDHLKPMKTNPLFSDTASTGNDVADSPRPRSFSNITEEEDQKVDVNNEEEKKEVPKRKNGVSDNNLERLAEISVEMEPSHTVPITEGKRTPYLKELDALIDTR